MCFPSRTLPRGPIVRVAIITLTYWLQKFTTPTRHVFSKFLFPNGESLPRGPIGRVAIITLTYCFQNVTTPMTRPPRPRGVGPKKKKIYNFSPIGSLVPCVTGEGPSSGLKGYRANQCVFSGRIQYILEK